MAESIENAVSDIEQPGTESQEQGREPGEAKMHGAGEEPRPESGDGGRIQAEQMPPFREVVEAAGQTSVYRGGQRGLLVPGAPSNQKPKVRERCLPLDRLIPMSETAANCIYIDVTAAQPANLGAFAGKELISLRAGPL